MKKLTMTVLAAVLLAGCARQQVPEWVKKGSWAYPQDRGKALYAVGIAHDADPRIRRELARAHARAELARNIRTNVEETIKNTVFRRDSSGEGEPFISQAFTQVTEQFTDVALGGSQEKDTWIDEDGVRGKKGTLYLEMSVVLSDEFFKSVREQALAAAEINAAENKKAVGEE